MSLFLLSMLSNRALESSELRPNKYLSSSLKHRHMTSSHPIPHLTPRASHPYPISLHPRHPAQHTTKPKSRATPTPKAAAQL